MAYLEKYSLLQGNRRREYATKEMQYLFNMNQQIVGEYAREWMLMDFEAKTTWALTWCEAISRLK